MLEILTPLEMAEVDRLAIEAGPFSGLALMERAGAAIAALVLARFSAAARADVLCGPGNNGGDGYVTAEILRRSGMPVGIFAEGSPRSGSDAEAAASACSVAVRPLTDFSPAADTVVVDALYGAGLARAVSDDVAAAIGRAATAGCPVIAVDLPSGVSGESGAVLGHAFQADVTVTFVRRKPGHLLQPGRSLCGDVVVADIGIADATVEAMAPGTFENRPPLWLATFPSPLVDAHKYSRGHVAVVSGRESATGAARLSAFAAARAGAGAVTLLSPGSAMAVNAAHLTATMLRQAETASDIADFLVARRSRALVFGPGLEPTAQTAAVLLELLAVAGGTAVLVVDAGALTAIAANPDALFSISGGLPAARMVLTPHQAEFERVFPDIAADGAHSKLERARQAARRSNAVVVYKGPDTVIAGPDGRAAINLNGTAFLATAGSGDVLAGIIAGLAAQGMPAFEASCAAVWMHAEAGSRFGPGLVAEDLPDALLPVLRELHSTISSSQTRR